MIGQDLSLPIPTLESIHSATARNQRLASATKSAAASSNTSSSLTSSLNPGSMTRYHSHSHLWVLLELRSSFLLHLEKALYWPRHCTRCYPNYRETWKLHTRTENKTTEIRGWYRNSKRFKVWMIISISQPKHGVALASFYAYVFATICTNTGLTRE